RPWDLTGKEAEHLLEAAGITVNKNTIPYDTASPFVTSGVRIGTAAITTRGMKEADMETIGRAIAAVLKDKGSEAATARVKSEIRGLCESYPLYQQLAVR
ncbi:serine hydroxymethyltransferase, partial [Mesorhizobium sp. M00.F.Ca.ET.186.01.1.1]